MDHRHRLLIIGLGIALAGTGSGYALGGFATGGGGKAASDPGWWESEASADASPANGTDVAPPLADGPEHYSCKGCGPTLAERRAGGSMGDYASAGPITTMDDLGPPAGHATPSDAGAHVDLPDLGAPVQ